MLPSIKIQRLILVVDDNARLREALAVILESAGYQVVQASEGDAATALARERSVALLITDMVMPGREGVETIRQFGKDFPLIPIIAISGNSEYLHVAELTGAAVVLAKPFGQNDLLMAVQRLIG